LPEKVAEVIDALGDRQDLGWCCNRIKWVDINGKPNIPESLQKGSASESSQGKPKHEYDVREYIKSGKVRNKIPNLTPTSGLSFRRSLLQQILPMPEVKGIGLNDFYLDCAGLGLSKFIIVEKNLTLYRFHGSNAFALTKDSQKVKARINILTSYWVRVKFPSFYKFTNKIFASGIGLYARAGGVDTEQEIVKNYLSVVALSEKVEIYSRALYHYIRNTKD
jgi:hypothetical protein